MQYGKKIFTTAIYHSAMITSLISCLTLISYLENQAFFLKCPIPFLHIPPLIVYFALKFPLIA